MMWVKVLLTVATVMMMSRTAESSQAMVKDMTKNFLAAYGACQKELNLSESVVNDMVLFWKEGYELKNREAGCALVCLSGKLELLDPQGMLHKGKTTDFIKQHNVDDDTANKVIDLIHSCEANAAPNDDHCMKAIDIAMCFKKGIHELNWAPDHELLLEEMVAEMQ